MWVKEHQPFVDFLRLLPSQCQRERGSGNRYCSEHGGPRDAEQAVPWEEAVGARAGAAPVQPRFATRRGALQRNTRK